MALQANASHIHIASEFGLLIAHDKNGTLSERIGATVLWVMGLSAAEVANIQIGQHYRVGGVHNPYGKDLHETLHTPFSLPYARAASKGADLSADTVQFVQVIAPPSV
ncbi:MAG: hypothetical protein GC191_13310 [Azospirillum sp.]|nr:hypothetical protein [Azospirillum sp.]